MIYDKEHYNQVLAFARSYRNDVERLEKQLAITEKALELALATYSEKHLSNYFIKEAKEILKNE